ncbi:MAG: F-type H+/Na+-transporting ATPase subunit beta, partial [Candidatus Dependentiae bacterium]|nr:F-type H+/Na+-transporting ATPase subunit beta [Candidatus Dependentiae bacterium]
MFAVKQWFSLFLVIMNTSKLQSTLTSTAQNRTEALDALFANNDHLGLVLRTSGTIVDVQFSGQKLPQIHNQLVIKVPSCDKSGIYSLVSVEVAQHVGDGVVRCIALEALGNISRGVPVADTGAPIKVPVGPEVLGHVFDVLGRTIDGTAQVKGSEEWPIYRNAPTLIDQDISNEILETGIKVIDLLCPYLKGSNIGLFGGAGVGKTVLIQEMIYRVAENFGG